MQVTFYFNNKKLENFNEIWTNRILFEKILELKLTSPCDIFLIRPSYENDNPFEVINTMSKDKKIILWYMDTLSEELYNLHKKEIHNIYMKIKDITL